MRILNRRRLVVCVAMLVVLAVTALASVNLGLTRVMLTVAGGDTGYVTWYRYANADLRTYGPFYSDYGVEWNPGDGYWYGIFSYSTLDGRYTRAWYTLMQPL